MNLIKIETDRGWEVWPDAVGARMVCVFVKERDADRFIEATNLPNFVQLALKVAEAYPALNLSDAPLNPSGELVLNIARIIEQNWFGTWIQKTCEMWAESKGGRDG